MDSASNPAKPLAVARYTPHKRRFTRAAAATADPSPSAAYTAAEEQWRANSTTVPRGTTVATAGGNSSDKTSSQGTRGAGNRRAVARRTPNEHSKRRRLGGRRGGDRSQVQAPAVLPNTLEDLVYEEGVLVQMKEKFQDQLRRLLVERDILRKELRALGDSGVVNPASTTSTTNASTTVHGAPVETVATALSSLPSRLSTDSTLQHQHHSHHPTSHMEQTPHPLEPTVSTGRASITADPQLPSTSAGMDEDSSVSSQEDLAYDALRDILHQHHIPHASNPDYP